MDARNNVMRLCILGSALSNHVVARADVFRTLGHDVTLISPSAGRVALPPGSNLTVVDCRSGTRGKFDFLIRVLRAVWSARADVYHAHYAAELTTWAAWLLRKRPLVITVMGGDVLFGEQGTLGPLGRWLTRRAIKAADLVTVKSRYLGDIAAAWGVPRERIMNVIWGVDAGAFEVEPDAALSRRADWHVEARDMVLFSPRMLKPLYNQMLMVEAFAKVHETQPDARLVLSTYNADPAYRDAVASRAKTLGVNADVRFVDAIDAADMPASYAAADIVLSLPPSDGTPQSVLEAMASGTPVISADIDHLRDLFRHGETVWVSALEPDSIANGMNAILDDAELRERIAAGARRLVREKADFPSQARAVEQRLLSLAGNAA